MYAIPKYITPRNCIPIKNKYFITNSYGKFHCVLYYIDDKNAKLIIRNLVEEKGWEETLKLKISDNQNEEVLEINKNDNNSLTINIQVTKVNLEPVDLNKNQKIPKRIIQTYWRDTSPSILHYNTILSFIDLNPEYEYVFYNDKMCRDLIKNNFPSNVLYAFDSLKSGSFKADIFRCCYLYLYGGCYFDCKLINRTPLRDVIKEDDELILCLDRLSVPGIYNAIILSAPKNDIFLQVITSVVNTINAKDYSDFHKLFGPTLWYSVYSNLSQEKKNKIKISIQHISPEVIVIDTKEMITSGFNHDYRKYYNNICYHETFKMRQSYYDVYYAGKYVIKMFPPPQKINFHFSVKDNILKVKRVDNTNSWDYDLKIILLDSETYEEKTINIGSSKCTKFVDINTGKLIHTRLEIPKNLAPRNDIPIKNKYIINDSQNLHYVIYYISDSRVKLIIRNMESIDGWDKKLTLKIFDQKNEETIIIDEQEDNYINKIIDLKIVKVEPLDISKEQRIPKRIIQTFWNNKSQSILHHNTILSFIELNPEYEYVFYNDKMCRELIKNNFPSQVLTAYDILTQGSIRCDIFRLCYLYLYGGCYFDCKLINKTPLREFIDKDDEIILCEDMKFSNHNGYYNAVIMTAPKNPLIFETMNKTVKFILNRDYSNFYNIFGPSVLYDTASFLHFNKMNVKFRNVNFKVTEIKTNKVLITGINADYYDYYKGRNYVDVFLKRELYFNEIITFNKYLIFVFPHTNPDRFEFHVSYEKILVRRTDRYDGWGMHLKIKLLNTETNEERMIFIGPSPNNNNIKLVYIDCDDQI
ncbi:MAG: glycosyltransferase [Candidatus Micrarchaeaceae archaeon]